MSQVEHDREIDGYRWKLDQVRGEYRGTLFNVRRELVKALEACQTDIPYLPATIERIENALTLIKGQLND